MVPMNMALRNLDLDEHDVATKDDYTYNSLRDFMERLIDAVNKISPSLKLYNQLFRYASQAESFQSERFLIQYDGFVFEDAYSDQWRMIWGDFVVAWYKHPRRSLQCNRELSQAEQAEFISQFKEDLLKQYPQEPPVPPIDPNAEREKAIRFADRLNRNALFGKMGATPALEEGLKERFSQFVKERQTMKKLVEAEAPLTMPADGMPPVKWDQATLDSIESFASKSHTAKVMLEAIRLNRGIEIVSAEEAAAEFAKNMRGPDGPSNIPLVHVEAAEATFDKPERFFDKIFFDPDYKFDPALAEALPGLNIQKQSMNRVKDKIVIVTTPGRKEDDAGFLNRIGDDDSEPLWPTVVVEPEVSSPFIIPNISRGKLRGEIDPGNRFQIVIPNEYVMRYPAAYSVGTAPETWITNGRCRPTPLAQAAKFFVHHAGAPA